jgi:ABC-type uncharacterized transport system substrate-binding protein
MDQTTSISFGAGYVDRMLKGKKPANLPVQAPVKYETVINLTTAKALGIDIPGDSGVRPWWWTVSGGGFDRLLGVAILVLRGAQVA